MKKLGLPLSIGLAVALGACGSDTTAPGGSTCGPAASASVRGAVSGAGASASLGTLQATTINSDGLAGCLSLAADSGTYLLVPQFATAGGPGGDVSFVIGAGQGTLASVVASMSPFAAPAAPAVPLQQQLDVTLRTLEHRLAPGAPTALAQWRASADRRISRSTLPVVGSTRTFDVLASLSGGAFTTDTAVLRYAGSNIMIYVSVDAPPPPQGFTDTQLASFGQLFDGTLYGVDIGTFGNPSDIDGNGHVIVLLTPKVNKLTPSAECQTQGYVSGFFYGLDLEPSQPHSNKGEIFYSMVPDPDSVYSCAHTVSQVEFNTPATFIHEFQHMISWNQHVIVRNGPDEALWLNEGMSHIAEEMGSRYYEHKYPAPLGRSDPTQLFPDSAEGFISGDLFNSYDFLLDPSKWSITKFIQGGQVQERGGVWLFLRWLGDQKDSTIYTRLEQTSLTGISNVEAQSGEKFPQLFGDFSLALYTDSLPGLARESVGARWRFASRNLRQLYDRLYSSTTRRDLVPRPWPIPVQRVSAPGTAISTMVPGTEEFFALQMPKGSGSTSLEFGPTTTTPFAPALDAQVTVFRCPSASVCQ